MFLFFLYQILKFSRYHIVRELRVLQKLIPDTYLSTQKYKRFRCIDLKNLNKYFFVVGDICKPDVSAKIIWEIFKGSCKWTTHHGNKRSEIFTAEGRDWKSITQHHHYGRNVEISLIFPLYYADVFHKCYNFSFVLIQFPFFRDKYNISWNSTTYSSKYYWEKFLEVLRRNAIHFRRFIFQLFTQPYWRIFSSDQN